MTEIMRWQIPKRFSQDWWLCLAVSTLVIAVLVGLFLHNREQFSPGSLALWIVGASALGDILLALYFEARAPSTVVIGPGDRKDNDSTLIEEATVVSGFAGDRSGKVTVRGEIWTAAYAFEETACIRSGDRVRIVGRAGLTLMVSSSANDS
jgi:membrane protein implicated in regulation of membrane protease activity